MVHAEKVGGSSRSQYQIIVTYRAYICYQEIFFRQYLRGLCHPKVKLILILKDLSDGCGNVVRLQTCRRHLIKQWLEGVIIVAVDHNHLILGMFQGLGQLKPGKTTSQNDDSGSFI